METGLSNLINTVFLKTMRVDIILGNVMKIVDKDLVCSLIQINQYV